MPETDLVVKALLGYSVHEHQLGHTRRIDVWLALEQIALQDDGRGIGLDRDGYVERLLGTLVGRSSDVQLHGIGLSLIAAVTPLLVVQSTRSGVTWKQSFRFGVAAEPATRLPFVSDSGTFITLAGLPPLSESGVASLAAQSEVWQAAHPGLVIALHQQRRPNAAGDVA